MSIDTCILIQKQFFPTQLCTVSYAFLVHKFPQASQEDLYSCFFLDFHPYIIKIFPTYIREPSINTSCTASRKLRMCKINVRYVCLSTDTHNRGIVSLRHAQRTVKISGMLQYIYMLGSRLIESKELNKIQNIYKVLSVLIRCLKSSSVLDITRSSIS